MTHPTPKPAIATVFYRDQESAELAAIKLAALGHDADVTPVTGGWPWCVTFRPEWVM